MTTPDFVPAMKRAAAIVTERAAAPRHAAIVSRELGIPCVVGTEQRDGSSSTAGQLITVDGSRGSVYEGRAEVRLAWAEEEKERRRGGLALKTTHQGLRQPGGAGAGGRAWRS